MLGQRALRPDGTSVGRVFHGTLLVVTGPSASMISRAAARLVRVRWFVRVPIWLYRARVGFLLGGRFLMLEHVGRKSGRRRYVVLEVIDRPSAGKYVVASGFGERAQWFRNIVADPQVLVHLGGRRPRAARAQRLDPDAAAASLSRYAGAHPRSWAALRPVLEQMLGARIDKDGADLPLIVFDTTAAGTQRPDLSSE